MFSFLLLISNRISGQVTKDTIHQIDLYEVVITATRYEQNTFSSARAVTVAGDQEIKEKNRFSILDVLDDKMGIWIEKRTTTTSDPVIRGLSGGNLLALVDGVTLSTFWGEGGFAGDDMYGKVDAESVGRIEIIRGPASVIYGSNALGGVFNFLTKKSPLEITNRGFQAGGRIKGAFGSSSDYRMGRIETWGASSALKYFVGSSVHSSGNMRAGGEIGRISPSGGKDWSLDANAQIRLDQHNSISISGQYFDRTEAYRSYKPKEMNTNKRLGIQIGYANDHSNTLFDKLEVNLYSQYKKDTRTWYKDIEFSKLDKEGYAWWQNYSMGVHALKATGAKNKILYGASYQVDIAESPDDEQFTVKTPDGDQMASPKTHWNNLGVYLQDEWDLVKWATLSGGIRYDYFLLKAGDELFYTKPGDPDTAINKAMVDPGNYNKNSLTGSAACVFHLNEKINLAINWAHGFRMFPPSFGFRQTGYGVIIPNGLLAPATANMFEISPRYRSNSFEFIASIYYTKFQNFQQPIPGEYNGNKYIDYNHNGTYEPNERVYVNAPDGDAFVTGVELELEYALGSLTDFLRNFHIAGGFMYNYGRMKYHGQDEVPLRHTHPPRGLIKLRYDLEKEKFNLWGEFTTNIVGRYDQIEKARLNSDVGYLENPQDTKSGLYRDYGLPSYTVFDIRGGVRLFQNVTMTLEVENIFDIRYRSAHSRMDASGRSVLVGVEVMVASINGKK